MMTMDNIQRWITFRDTAELVTVANALGLATKINDSSIPLPPDDQANSYLDALNNISKELDLILEMIRKQEITPSEELLELNDLLLTLFIKYSQSIPSDQNTDLNP